ncbi:hypothetical protein ACFL1B_04370 [Nanoarchaeota archaeon]
MEASGIEGIVYIAGALTTIAAAVGIAVYINKKAEKIDENNLILEEKTELVRFHVNELPDVARYLVITNTPVNEQFPHKIIEVEYLPETLGQDRSLLQRALESDTWTAKSMYKDLVKMVGNLS